MSIIKKEVPLTNTQMESVFKAASINDSILVGGQALAFWIDHYQIKVPDELSVTIDVDILGDLSSLFNISEELKIKAVRQSPKVMSALVGLININQNENEKSTVDVIHKISGMDKESVKRKALKAEFNGIGILVMHPVDVLESRFRNVAMFKDRRSNPKYITQCELSCLVVNAYIKNCLKNGMERLALKAIEAIVLISKTEPGKCATRIGIELIKSLPLKEIKNENFKKHRLDQVVDELGSKVKKTKP